MILLYAVGFYFCCLLFLVLLLFYLLFFLGLLFRWSVLMVCCIFCWIPSVFDSSFFLRGVFNHPWGDKPANNKETYGLSTLGAGSDLSRTFFLITCTTCFTRLLASFRRYIQHLVSMSNADGLASTNLLLLYILAIYLHIYVLCFENTRYIW